MPIPHFPSVDPRVVTNLNRVRLALDLRELEMINKLAREWALIERGLLDELAQISRRVWEIGNDINLPQAMYLQAIRREQYIRDLLKQVSIEYSKFATDVAPEVIMEAQREFAQLGIASAQDAIAATYSEEGLIKAFSKINVDAVESMFGFAGDGSPLKELLLKDFGNTLTEQALQGLVEGMALGLNPAQIAEKLTNAMAMGLDRSLLIARTEASRAYRTASTQQYRESGVVTGFMRLVKKATACASCLLLDGEKFDVAEEMYDHPNGKCMVVPIVEGVQPPSWFLGSEYFDTLSDDQKIKLLGRKRFALLQEGLVKRPTDFVGVHKNYIWGNSPKLLNFDELENGKFKNWKPPTPTAPPPTTSVPTVPATPKSGKKGYSKRGTGPVPDTEYQQTVSHRGLGSIDGYTDSQTYALHQYKGTDYSDINGHLRGNRRPLIGDELREVEEHIRQMDSAFESSILGSDKKVWRGLGSGRSIPQLDVGVVFSDLGYSSTTTSKVMANRFGSPIIEILLPKGTRAIYMEPFDPGYNEQEWLLERGHTYEVVGSYIHKTLGQIFKVVVH